MADMWVKCGFSVILWGRAHPRIESAAEAQHLWSGGKTYTHPAKLQYVPQLK